MVALSGRHTERRCRANGRVENLAERIYLEIKNDIFDFRLLPGDRFTETEVAGRMGVSRTPVREALFRLQRENYVDVLYRNGWQVRPFNFEYFEDLYDVRTVLECAAVKRICDRGEMPVQLEELKKVWLVPEDEMTTDIGTLSALDEQFHEMLVDAAGNGEMVRIHRSVSERIRIIRRLDFTRKARIDATYSEHAKILRAIIQRRADQAQMMLKAHIEASRNEVRKITLHMLHSARIEATSEK
jgi:DNA-binding GntR family transcriptional regulator